MKRFEVITIFPVLFNDFSSQSLIARAIKKKLIAIKAHQLRDWTTDNHKTVDGRPYGGGAGMVLMVEPIVKAVAALRRLALRRLNLRGKGGSTSNTRVILLSAKGKQFTQKDARRLEGYDQLVFICGRYEGVDERIADAIADEEISVGPYVLFGGEIPTMVVIEAVARLIPGVVQKEESVRDESHSTQGELEYPQYTRPEVFSVGKKKHKVPPVLLSGNHALIKHWRDKHRT